MNELLFAFKTDFKRGLLLVTAKSRIFDQDYDEYNKLGEDGSMSEEVIERHEMEQKIMQD